RRYALRSPRRIRLDTFDGQMDLCCLRAVRRCFAELADRVDDGFGRHLDGGADDEVLLVEVLARMPRELEEPAGAETRGITLAARDALRGLQLLRSHLRELLDT